MISVEASNISWLGAAGLLWDLAAAIYLGRGFFASDAQIRRQAGTYWDLSPPALRGLCEQRRDIRYGIGHLIIGFILQLTASVGVTVTLGISLLTIAPMAMVLDQYCRRYGSAVVLSCLRIMAKKRAIREQTWRRRFSDISDRDWESAVLRSKVVFSNDP